MDIQLDNLNNISFNGYDVQTLVYNGVTLWSKPAPTPTVDPYFTIEIINDNASISLTSVGSATSNIYLDYWVNTTPDSTRSNKTGTIVSTNISGSHTISGLSSGDIVKFYNSSTTAWGQSSSKYVKLTCNKKCNIYGDMSSLIGYASTLPSYAFTGIFNGSAIADASGLYLKWETLAESCYEAMFTSVSLLTAAPQLPATTLARFCYYQMFYNCTNLVSSPELPAATLEQASYGQMFRGCSKLNYVRCYATSISASLCTQYWLYGVASSGTFVKASGVSWSRDTNGIPSGWTVQTA